MELVSDWGSYHMVERHSCRSVSPHGHYSVPGASALCQLWASGREGLQPSVLGPQMGLVVRGSGKHCWSLGLMNTGYHCMEHIYPRSWKYNHALHKILWLQVFASAAAGNNPAPQPFCRNFTCILKVTVKMSCTCKDRW